MTKTDYNQLVTNMQTVIKDSIPAGVTSDQNSLKEYVKKILEFYHEINFLVVRNFPVGKMCFILCTLFVSLCKCFNDH